MGAREERAIASFLDENAIVPAALQLVRYTSKERLYEIIHYHQEKGIYIAEPHVYILKLGGRKKVDAALLKFKEMVNPYGLKMRVKQEELG